MKFPKLAACLIGLSSLLGAATSPPNPWRFEPRAAAFFPTGDLFRRVYGTVGGSYQLVIAREFSEFGDFWMNYDYVNMGGFSTSHRFHERTRIQIGNAAAGLSLLFPFDDYDTNHLYLGVGPSVAGVWIHDQLRSRDVHRKHIVVGGLFKLGYMHTWDCRWVLDIFADYLYQNLHHKTEIGGVKLGAGLGFKF
jgi:hypothetical protein